MEAPIQQTQDTEGQPEITSGSQATETIAQPQEVSQTQVEGGQQRTSQVPAEGTSEYETARQIKSLMKEIRSLKQSFETRSSAQPSAQPAVPVPLNITQDEFLKDPMGSMRRMIESETSKVRGEIPQALQQREIEMRRDIARQDAAKLIKTNEAFKRDPEAQDRIQAILYEEDDDGNSLDKYSLTNPKHAAQLALKEYQTRYGSPQRGAFAPSKGQMTSTATAQTSGAGKGNTEAEMTAIYKQIEAMPDLMKDPQFMAKLNAVVKKSDIESRIGK